MLRVSHSTPTNAGIRPVNGGAQPPHTPVSESTSSSSRHCRQTGEGRCATFKPDFAAVIAPGLNLAFEDSVTVRLAGTTIAGERASRHVNVCGPGAFIALKALAFRERGENKDAYDLYYMLRYYGTGIDAVADRLRPLLDDAAAQSALGVLREDFTEHDAVGARRAGAFLNAGQSDDDIQADVVGFATQLLERLDAP